MILARAHDARERHPQWWVALVSTAAWGTMVAGVARSAEGSGHDHGAPLRALGPWVVMVLAMMVPLTLPTLRNVARSSLWRRRHRAVVVFLAGYLTVWTAAGLVVLEALHAAEALLGGVAAALLAVIGAVAWERGGVRRRALVRCRRSAPLAPRGWRADRDAFRFGADIGWSCLVSCWATMSAVVSLGHHVTMMAIAFAFQLHRRLRAR